MYIVRQRMPGESRFFAGQIKIGKDGAVYRDPALIGRTHSTREAAESHMARIKAKRPSYRLAVANVKEI